MIYEYICPNCKNVDEEVRHVNERDNELLCSRCKSISIRRTVYPIVFSFKGGPPSLYPMVCHNLPTKEICDDGTVIRHPTVWNSPREREQYMDKHDLVDAITPSADHSTMYEDDTDWPAYEKAKESSTKLAAMTAERGHEMPDVKFIPTQPEFEQP
jgi:putative FmdB family regulatory protein